MTDGNAWTEWTEHTGDGCPLPAGTVVQEVVERAPGVDRSKWPRFSTRNGIAGEGNIPWDWSHWGEETEKGLLSRVVRYRVRRYPAASHLIARCADVREDA